MKKVGRKVVSVLLTLCMLLTMLPVSALAADEGTVDTAPAESTPVETTEPAVETESGELLDASDSTEQDSTVDTSWYQVNSETKEYTITTAAELAGLAQLVNDGTDTFQGWTITLGANINLMDYSWTPIGKKDAPFKGTFDGQNGKYTISNLSIDDETLTNAGLFGVLNTPGVIKNVTIENASVTAKSEAGALIGTSHTGALENCMVTGTVNITANYKVGGLSGGGYADITDCHVNATGSVIGNYKEADLEGDNVGGLIGFLGEGDTTLTNCSVSGLTVTGTRKVGGIVGSAFTNNHVEGCDVTDVIVASNATADYIAANASSAGIGGIVGVYTANGADDGSLTDCSVSGVTFNAPMGVTTGELTAGMRDTTAGELVVLPDTMTQDTVAPSEDIIEIDSDEDLVNAIKNQADGQTWVFTAAGEYNAKPSDADGYTLTEENAINGSTGPFVFPIYVDNLTIQKDSSVTEDVVLTSSAVIAQNIGGNWNWQNFITVGGNNVKIDGVDLKMNQNLYYSDTNNFNKAIELIDNAKTFTLHDSEIKSEGGSNGKFSGSIYINVAEPENILIEDVTLYAWISGGAITNEGKVTIRNVVQDYRGNAAAALEGYGPGLVGDDAAYVIEGFTILADEASCAQYGLAQVLNGDMKSGTTYVLEAGEYTGNVTINKSITLEGANAGVSGTATRGGESIITGQIAVTGENLDVVIDGLSFTGAGCIDAAGGHAYNKCTGTDLTVQNCVADGLSATFLYTNADDSHRMGTITAKDNKVTNITGTNLSAFNLWGASKHVITGNYIENINYHACNLNSTVGDVLFENNTIKDTGKGGFQIAGSAAGGTVTIQNNTFDGTADEPVSGDRLNYAAIRMYGDLQGATINITENEIVNSAAAIWLQNYDTVTEGTTTTYPSLPLSATVSKNEIEVTPVEQGGYGLYVWSSTPVDASGNYWGTADVTEIDSLIYGRTESDVTIEDYYTSADMTEGSLVDYVEPVAGVAQIGEETYPTLEAAFAAVKDNQETTITLLKDIAVSAPITIGEAKSVIFDMKGHTITAGEGFSTRVFTNNGTLTITGNGTIDVTAAGASGYGAVNNFGTLNVVDGTYKNLKESNASTFYNRNGGTATFGNPTIYGGGGCIGTEVNTTTTINGGYYENETYPAVENRGNMTITAGTFKNTSCSSCDGSKWGYTVRSGESSENAYLKIQGAAADSVKVTGVQGGLAVIGGTADIYNGIYETVACDVHTTGSSAFYAGYFTGESYETAVTIHDGTFKSVSRTAVLVGNDNPPPDSGAGEASTVMIKGGTFIGGDVEKTAVKVENTAYAKGGASISGGTFSSMPSEEFFAAGYEPTENADGTWGVAKKNEAEINDKQYATLSEALTTVKDGETIKVLAPATVDMTETYAITGKTITLDLNGQTVTWNSSAKNMIEIGTDGGLTIQDATDAGVLHFIGTGTTSYGSGIYTSGNSSLSLTGGTVLYEHSSKAGYGLNITGSSTFTMTGGTVKIAGAVNYAVRLASTSQCQLNGGKILFDEGTTATTLYGVYAVLFSTAGDAAGFSLGNLTVDGSMVPDTKTVVCVYGYNDGTPVTISGGTYTANDKSTSYAVGGGSSNNTAISGGTFNGAVKAAIGKVTGGQFSEQPSAAYLPEGKIYELQQDGYYHVVDGTYVARLGTVGYTSWDALWKDASEGTTASAVYILADVNEITVPAGKNVTFYNSGNCTIGKITNNGTCKIISYAMTGTEVVNNGSLNLGHEVKSVVNNQGATMEATNYAYAKVTDSITNSGTMTISKGTYPCTITNTGTITLTGGSFAQEVIDWCEEGYTTQKSDGLWVVVKDGPHVAEIDGYWYTSLSAAINAAKDGDTVKLLMDTTLTPTTTGTGLKSAITISGVSKPNLTLDLNGKTISWDQTYADQTLSSTPVMFSISGGANITITGNGTIDTELGSNTSYGINMTISTKNQLTIENGTFTGAPTAIQVEKGTLTILDGTFKLAKTVAEDKPEQAKYVVNAIDANWKDDSANISIQGGSFCFDPSANPEGEGSSYVAEGFEAVVNADGSFGIAKVKVAEVGGVQYTSLAEAISNVTNGGTITLLCDFVQNDQLTITDKTFTLDMAGKTITLGKISDGAGAILLDGSSNVTITGNGGFTFNDDYFTDSSGQMIGVDGNATLTIENGNFYAGLVCVRAGESAKVYIKGGEYSAYAEYDGRMWLLNLQDNEGAKFYVSGGTFKNYDPSNSDTESPAGNFCTPEYAATPTTDESGNTIYTVVEAEARIGETGYVTLADAITAAETDATITLLTDVTEDVVVPEGKTITLDLNGYKITNAADHTIVNNGTLTITDSSEAKTGTVDNITHGKGSLVNNGTMILAGGTFERSQEAGTSTGANGNSWYTIANYGTMTIERGVTVKNSGSFSSMIRNSMEGVAGYLTINGGTFDGGINTIKNDDNSTLVINNGTFTNSAQYVIMNWNKATINGGTFETKDTAYAVLFTSSWQNAPTSAGELVITNGTFTTATETQKLIVDRYDESNIGTASISGGTFSVQPDEAYLAEGYAPEQNTDGDWVVVEDNSVAEIVGGQKYESLIDAVEAATAGQTVKLLANVELKPVEGKDYALLIDANQSMTLDLNGYKITATLNNTEKFNLIDNYGELTITDTSEGKNGSIEVTENGTGEEHTSILYNEDSTGEFTLEAGTLKLTGSEGSKKPLRGLYNYYSVMVVNGGAIEVRRLDNTMGINLDGQHWDVYGIYNYGSSSQTTVNGGKITVENHGRWNSAYGVYGFAGTTSIRGNADTPEITAIAVMDGTYFAHTVSGSITLYGGKYATTKMEEEGWDYNVKIADGYEKRINDDGTVSVVKSPVAQIGSTKYDTLEAAVAAVKSGETITMLTDVEEGSGIIVPSNSNFTIDFAGHTYKVVGNLAGSTGTESQCFQLLRDSNITMKDGTIVANNSGIQMIIQNYANLTLDGMTLDATQGTNNVGYVMSNNFGNVTITGNTNITAKDGEVAFDVFYWPGNGYVEGVTVTVDENMTGTINGKVEYAAHSSAEGSNVGEKAKLNIEAGTFIGSIVTTETNHGISISGGSFSEEPNKDYLAPYYEATQNTTGDNYWTVDVAANIEAIWITDTGEKAGMLSDLLDEAKSGTVQLLKDVTTTVPVYVKEGATLDLAGKTLTAEALSTFGGYVKDSTEGEGLLKVGSTLGKSNVTLREDNPSLPIYDSTNGGYRLYSYQFTSLRCYVPNTPVDSVQFWFQLTFTNEEAWDLLKSGDSHGVVVSNDYQFSDSQGWTTIQFNNSVINKVANQVDDYTQDGVGFYLNVTSTNLLGERSMMVKPLLGTSTPVKKEAGQMTYSLADSAQ